MATYEKCDQSVLNQIGTVYDRWHKLRLGIPREQIAIGAIWYRAKKDADDNTVGPPLRLHGYPCAATIKINSLKNRAQGMADVTITIDEDWWNGHSEAEQIAVLDHELQHLEPAPTSDGEATDDLGRPRLKVKLHDLKVEGFICIAERHLESSVEFQLADRFATNHAQLFFPWATPPLLKEAERRKKLAENN